MFDRTAIHQDSPVNAVPRLVQHEIDERTRTPKLWVRRKRGNKVLICSGCGGRCSKIEEIRRREVSDFAVAEVSNHRGGGILSSSVPEVWTESRNGSAVAEQKGVAKTATEEMHGKLIALSRSLLTVSPPVVRRYALRVQASPLGSRFVRGTFWSVVGVVIARALSLLSFIVVARLVGRVGYGKLGVVQGTIMMFQVFAGTSFGMTATKHVAEFRVKDPEHAGHIAALSTSVGTLAGAILGFLLFAGAPWLAAHTLAAPQLSGLLRIGSVLLFLGALNGTQTGVLAGFESFKRIARINLFGGLVSFPITLGGAYWLGLEGVVWALVLGMGVNCVLTHLAVKAEANRLGVPIRLRGDLAGRDVLWSFTLPTMLGGVLIAPVYWICSALLVNRPSGYAEMGVYSAANQWFAALLFLPGILSQVLVPIFSERIGNGGIRQSSRLLKHAIQANALIVAPLFVLGSIASPLLMRSYGSGFAQGWTTLTVTLATAALLAIQRPVADVIVAAGRMWLVLGLNALWALTLLSLAVVGVRWGAFGLASARLGSYVFNIVFFGYAYYHIFRRRGAYADTLL